MCGIFGIIKPSGILIDEIEQLGQLNTKRGNISFGGLVWSPKNDQVFRFDQPFNANKIAVDDAIVVLGHIRAPTGGHSSDLRGVHPFETSDTLLAHNGILLNHSTFPNWQLMPDVEVDSQVIAGGIRQYLAENESIKEAIALTAAQLEGQQGCWLWYKPTLTIYLWRVISSLYYGHHADSFVFSSVKCELADNLLPEGVVYSVDVAAKKILATAEFDFYNPITVQILRNGRLRNE